MWFFVFSQINQKRIETEFILFFGKKKEKNLKLVIDILINIVIYDENLNKIIIKNEIN